ncbi:RNA polymerase sigma factor [Bordetella genomosp. 13]|uniref:RNA polymerase subunit sigma n=1 Tax=Bordetella genomosp. 13 TaxID=463040 RepID=A0A1W6ZC18_9BORD|nr:RNA polymerase sigma factor [Bordetella genomosp. 13]ARP94795.1 RNA polymerase subunit sigma [Bordetella genomosp. 13]
MDDPSGADDESLMQAYGARGDTVAFDTLYARHRARLYRYLLRGIGNPQQADDLFQETWSRVIDARARYRPEARFTTWLLQIAHNLLVDAYRRQPGRKTVDDAEAVLAQLPAAEHEQPEQQLSQFQARRSLQSAIERLPDEQRLALLMKWEHDLSVEDIAQATGTARETVKSRLRYAIRRIRDELGVSSRSDA